MFTANNSLSDGNAAALTQSNGEGAKYVIPETGIMLSNMPGEEAFNPYGLHARPMMSACAR